jgi:hypothetical protein
MKRQPCVWLLGFGLLIGVFFPSVARAQDWAVKADYTESCSCNPACPCVFGSPSTLGFCKGNGLVEIKEGHYGDTRLDGLAIAVTFRMGEWEKYYVSDKATDAQVAAAGKLMEAFFKSPNSKVLSIEKTPITIERTGGRIMFSTPVSKVEIEVMKGRNGKPIKIENLSDFPDYTQYKSITNSYKSDKKDMEFSYSGTNGLTAKLEGSSHK